MTLFFVILLVVAVGVGAYYAAGKKKSDSGKIPPSPPSPPSPSERPAPPPVPGM